MPRKLPKPKEFRNPRVQVSPKYWMKPSRFLQMLEHERQLKLNERQSPLPGSLMSAPIPPKDTIDFIARASERVIQFKPTAIVAVTNSGVAAARLVQHYIRRSTGQTFPVYIILHSRRQGTTRLFNERDAARLQNERRVAIVDDVMKTGGTLKAVTQLLRGVTGRKARIGRFPIISENEGGNIFTAGRTISPAYDLLKENREHRIHWNFANFQAYKNLLDDYMTARGIGVDKRRSSPRR